MCQMSPLQPRLLGPDIGDKGSERGSVCQCSPSAIVVTRVMTANSQESSVTSYSPSVTRFNCFL